MFTAISEQRDISTADVCQGDRRSHAGARGVIPVVTAGLCVKGIEVSILASDENAVAGNCRLTRTRRLRRKAEGPPHPNCPSCAAEIFGLA